MKKENMDRLTDKAFMRLIITSVLAICLCVVCLCSTTWAWFSDSNISGSSSITASSCSMVVTVGGAEYQYGTPIDPITIPAGNELVIQLEIPDDSASGYCIIKYDHDNDPATEEMECYTQAVSHTTGVTRVMFTVTADSVTQITIEPRWGMSSRAVCISDSDVFNLSDGAVSGANTVNENAAVEETETTGIETDTEAAAQG